MCRKLSVTELQEVLDALVAEGKIEVSSKGKYTKGTSPNLTGVFTAHARGFGFVTIEGETEDVFIPESSTNGAIQDDVVQIALVPSSGKRREGKVVKIVEHGLKRSLEPLKKAKILVLSARTIHGLIWISLFRLSVPGVQSRT